MINQNGDLVVERYVTNLDNEQLNKAIALILEHLKLDLIETNATKHGHLQLELRPYE